MDERRVVTFSDAVVVITFVDADVTAKVIYNCDLMRERNMDRLDACARVIQYFWWSYLEKRNSK